MCFDEERNNAMWKMHRLEGRTTTQSVYILKSIRGPEVELKSKVRQRQIQTWIYYRKFNIKTIHSKKIENIQSRSIDIQVVLIIIKSKSWPSIRILAGARL
jgi:hypothetical protein